MEYPEALRRARERDGKCVAVCCLNTGDGRLLLLEADSASYQASLRDVVCQAPRLFQPSHWADTGLPPIEETVSFADGCTCVFRLLPSRSLVAGFAFPVICPLGRMLQGVQAMIEEVVTRSSPPRTHLVAGAGPCS